MTLLPGGEQLKLRFEGWPWEGQAPRSLTRGFFFSTFGSPAPATGVSDPPLESKMIVDHLQLEMFDGTSTPDPEIS